MSIRGDAAGLVQTYFAGKDEVPLFAVEHLGELLRARVADALGGADAGDAYERLVRAMSVLAGADEREQDVEGRVWLAFLARAVVHERLRDAVRSGLAAADARARSRGPGAGVAAGL